MPSNEPDPEVEKALNLNIGLDVRYFFKIEIRTVTDFGKNRHIPIHLHTYWCIH